MRLVEHEVAVALHDKQGSTVAGLEALVGHERLVWVKSVGHCTLLRRLSTLRGLRQTFLPIVPAVFYDGAEHPRREMHPRYFTHLTHEPSSAPDSRKLCNSLKAARTALRYIRERRAKWFVFVASFIRSSFTNAQIAAKQWLLCALIVLVGDLVNEALDF